MKVTMSNAARMKVAATIEICPVERIIVKGMLGVEQGT